MKNILSSVKKSFADQIEIYLRRENLFQIVIPIFYEDGDMVDVYLEVSAENKDKLKITDCGMTLMRLSYTYDINSPAREEIFSKLLKQNAVKFEEGVLYLDTKLEFIYQNVMQFIGCQQKIYTMRLWQKQVVKSMFFEELSKFIESHLSDFHPYKNFKPLENYPEIEVDYSLSSSKKTFFLFGVNNKDNAKNVAIALLEFQKAKLPFMSMVIHENINDLPKKEQTYLTQNADKQFPSLAYFKETGVNTLERLATFGD